LLTVKRPIVQLGGKLHEKASAKSGAGDRLVFIDADTAWLLREHRKDQNRCNHQLNSPSPNISLAS
jgi:hypothetical protein